MRHASPSSTTMPSDGQNQLDVSVGGGPSGRSVAVSVVTPAVASSSAAVMSRRRSGAVTTWIGKLAVGSSYTPAGGDLRRRRRCGRFRARGGGCTRSVRELGAAGVPLVARRPHRGVLHPVRGGAD